MKEKVKIVREFLFEYEIPEDRARLLNAAIEGCFGMLGCGTHTYRMELLKSKELKKQKKTR